MNTLQRLYAEFGQSPWVDSIDRHIIESGGLGELIREGIRGLTSNPTIFAKAIAGGYYDDLIGRLHADGADGQAIYEAIAVGDIRDAADLLRPVYDDADGADGLASIEVEPALANDSQASLERARELWARVERPNIFVKIPATSAGLPAIESAISEGINVNITLMFSVDVYRDVARAYIRGLRRLRADGGDVSRIASVASFFVSRVDTKVDRLLDGLGTDAARRARGTTAVANAQLAYQAYGEIFGGEEFADLRESGARVQRCLWASTSTKDPVYRDVKYVEALIGPDTVDTMPRETIAAMLDHGELQRTLDAEFALAAAQIAAIEALGISMRQVTDELIDEGVKAFGASFDELMATIDAKRRALATA
ncbi:MAG: transaldolase [Candidatus Limnocylindria bacterium]